MDRLSALPVSIQSWILFHLPPKQIFRTCVLSRYWGRFVRAIEERCFTVNLSTGGENHGEKVQALDESLHCMSSLTFQIPQFNIEVDFSDSKTLVSEYAFLDRCIKLACKNYLKAFSLLITRNKIMDDYVFPAVGFVSLGGLKKLVLSGCTIRTHSLCDETEQPLALEQLVLDSVVISDARFQGFLNRCLSLASFCMEKCRGVNQLHLTNLPKLTSILIDASLIEDVTVTDCVLESVEIACTPKLRSLFYMGASIHQKLLLKGSGCGNVLHLQLTSVDVAGIIDHIWTYFPILESLKLDECSCELSSPFVLEHTTLRTVRLYFNRLDQLVVCNTPNLQFFKICTFNHVPTELCLPTSPNLIKKACLHIMCMDTPIDSTWFLDLRKYIGKFDKSVEQNLRLSIFSHTEFNMNEVEEANIPDPPCDIPLLKLNFSLSAGTHGPFLKGLFWSCHPMLIRVKPSSCSNIEFLKFAIHEVKNARVALQCCSTAYTKCWLHCLKDIAVINNAGEPKFIPLEVESVLEHLATYDEVWIALDWF